MADDTPKLTPEMVGLRADLEAVLARESQPGGIYYGRADLVELQRQRMAAAEKLGALDPAPDMSAVALAQRTYDAGFQLDDEALKGVTAMADERLGELGKLASDVVAERTAELKDALGADYARLVADAQHHLKARGGDAEKLLALAAADRWLLLTLGNLGRHERQRAAGRPS